MTRCSMPSIPFLLVLLCLSTPAGAAELRVCFLDDDPPRARRTSGQGLDLQVMSEVAAALDLRLSPVWLESRTGFSEIEETDLPLAALARGDCDAVASVPGPMALGRFGSELELTRPYYGAGFELVLAEGQARRRFGTLPELKGLTVAVRLQSLAHFALQAVGVNWTARPSTAAVLESLDQQEAEAALVFGPSLADSGRNPQPGWMPPVALRWNEHVAVRRSSHELRQQIDEALGKLVEEGKVVEWMQENAAAAHPPFAAVSSRQALRQLGLGGGGRQP